MEGVEKCVFNGKLAISKTVRDKAKVTINP